MKQTLSTRKAGKATTRPRHHARRAGDNLGIDERKPSQTRVSQWLLLISAVVMWVIGLRHVGEEWGMLAITQGFLGYGGYVLLQVETVGFGARTFLPAGPVRKGLMEYAWVIVYTMIGLFGIYLTQYLTQFAATLEISAIEQALYHIFCGATETMLFQVALVKLGEVAGGSTGKGIAAVLSSVLFAALHFNYYGNWPALEAAWACGLWLGILFAMTDDATSTMACHVIWNALLQFKFGVILSAMMPGSIGLIVLIFCGMLFCVIQVRREGPTHRGWKILAMILVVLGGAGIVCCMDALLSGGVWWWF